MSRVWSESRQDGGKLLVLLALADFSNDSGECYPSISTLARKARLDERHVRRVCAELEKAGELEISRGKGRGGSNLFRVLFPTPDILPPPDAGTPPPLTPTSATPDADAPLTVRTVIEPSRAEEAGKFVTWFIDLLKQTSAPNIRITDAVRANWADCYDKLLRIDGRTKEEVVAVCRWARTDDFWRQNFLSPMKLRSKNRDGVLYYDVFSNRMKANKSHATAPTRSNERSFEQKNDYSQV